MNINHHRVYRYLRLRSLRRGFVLGTTVARDLRIPFHRLPELDDIVGVGGLAPARGMRSSRDGLRYARRSGYMATDRYLVRVGERIYFQRGHTVRKGRLPANVHRVSRFRAG